MDRAFGPQANSLPRSPPPQMGSSAGEASGITPKRCTGTLMHAPKPPKAPETTGPRCRKRGRRTRLPTPAAETAACARDHRPPPRKAPKARSRKAWGNAPGRAQSRSGKGCKPAPAVNPIGIARRVSHRILSTGRCIPPERSSPCDVLLDFEHTQPSPECYRVPLEMLHIGILRRTAHHTLAAVPTGSNAKRYRLSIARDPHPVLPPYGCRQSFWVRMRPAGLTITRKTPVSPCTTNVPAGTALPRW